MVEELEKNVGIFDTLLSDDKIYQLRISTTVDTMLYAAIKLYTKDYDELQTLINNRKKLLDIFKTNTEQLTVNLGGRTPERIIDEIHMYNNSIFTRYLKLEYQKKQYETLFGSRHNFPLPDNINVGF